MENELKDAENRVMYNSHLMQTLVGASIARLRFGGIAQTNPAKSSKKAPLTRGLAPEWATGGSSAITLISLVITIIVLLILAGVTISLTIGERGIFTTAQRAAQNYKDAQDRELAELGEFENVMNNTINGLNNGAKNVAVSKIEITPSTATIVIGETLDLTANIQPTSATNKVVTWKSSDESVASVDATGKVTALAVGNATLTAISNYGENGAIVTGTCSVIVTYPTLASIGQLGDYVKYNTGVTSVGENRGDYFLCII